MSLPYHIGNGWFGGFLPVTSFAIVAATGNIYNGLWYPIVVAAITVVIGAPVPARDEGIDRNGRIKRFILARAEGGWGMTRIKLPRSLALAAILSTAAFTSGAGVPTLDNFFRARRSARCPSRRTASCSP
jgi:hypothetical protein